MTVFRKFDGFVERVRRVMAARRAHKLKKIVVIVINSIVIALILISAERPAIQRRPVRAARPKVRPLSAQSARAADAARSAGINTMIHSCDERASSETRR